MKLMKVFLIIFFEVIELLAAIRGDHMRLLRCSKKPQCLQDLDQTQLEMIKESLKNTTEPCEHFWNYACGSWTSAPYYDHVDNFGVVSNYYADNLIISLQELLTLQLDTGIQELIDQLMTYFLSCKSMENYNLNMALYLKELPVHKIFGESFKWSHIFEENENIWQNFNWLGAVAYLRKYGFKELFLQESVRFAWSNSQQYVMELKLPDAKNTFESSYKVLQIMQEFDLIFGYNSTKSYLKLAHQIYKFDKEVLNLYVTYEHSRQDYFISLQDLPQLASDIDWPLYFRVLFNQVPPPQIPIEFSGNFKYFQDLDALIKRTPKNIQGSYILIKFCQYLMDIRPLITDRECLLHTNVMFPVGVNYIYNRFLYENRREDEEVLKIIFSLLKLEFSKILQENKFSLSAQELQYLQDKLNQMQLKIGNFPLRSHDINLYYSSIELNKNNFHCNHLKMLKFRTSQQHQVLLSSPPKLVNLDTYYINDDIAQLRNAPYFIHQRNMLIVPMLFLQLPFYHYTQHPVLQFSLVGWIIAHELSHAFDTHGLNFDAWGNGNLLGLQLSRKKAFLASVECLIKNSPAVSLNERMADVNGLQLAWQTFSHQIAKNKNEFYGNFSSAKLFFINFAQFFCGSLPRAIGHDRDDIRVRHSVANIRQFAEAFQCSNDDKENPAKKCYIWKK